ncbi:MAG: glycine radical domain-containing protein [Klebsiella pneumoniae]
MNIGMVHNFKFLKGLLDTRRVAMADYLAAYRLDSRQWPDAVQLCHNEVLKKAQQEPEKYRDLIVRVAGYSAYLSSCKEVEDEIISRTVIEKF